MKKFETRKKNQYNNLHWPTCDLSKLKDKEYESSMWAKDIQKSNMPDSIPSFGAML